MNLFKRLIIFTIFISKQCTAQVNFKSNIGFKVGLNNSNVSGFETNGAETGFVGTEAYGGFFVDTKIGKNTSLENEFLYSFTDDYHFIEFPIHIKHNIFRKFYGFYGVRLDVATTSRMGYKFEPIGYTAEIGTQFFISKKSFIELRYSNGFTKQINDYQLDILDGKRNTLRFGVGVKF